MNRLLLLAVVLASTASAQVNKSQLTVWFPDGAAVKIHTKSTGARSPLSTSGSVSVGQSDAHRVVLDGSNSVLFAYDIEARKTGHEFRLRLKPVDQQKFRAQKWHTGRAPSGDVATLSAAREFPPLRAGDAVEVDILQNPSTGEKIQDVITISDERPPAPLGSEPPPGERFSLQAFRLDINGKTIRNSPGVWMRGRALMVHLPGLGEYYLGLQPSRDAHFLASGFVDRNILRFHAGSDLVEIVGKTNILPWAEYGTIWVHHDPESVKDRPQVEELRKKLAGLRQRYAATHPDVLALEKKIFEMSRAIEFHCSDDMEALLAGRKRKRE